LQDHHSISSSKLQRELLLQLEGSSIRANELLDLLRRAVSNVRETDPSTQNCVLDDVKLQFDRFGVKVIAEFRK
jgi:hypothetical protein